MILTSSFDSVILYAGFTLSLSTFLTVLGIFVHRARYPKLERPYKTWGYPVVPVVYLLVMLYTLIFLVVKNPFESMLGFITLFSGTIFYILNWQSGKNSRSIKIFNSNDLK
jgi:APA family basic amino acid/polyamine antiporter